MQRKKLTREEITKQGEEYRRLVVLAETQLEEQKAFLRRVIIREDLPKATRNRVLQEVDELRLSFVKVDAHNIKQKLLVKVIYEFGDDLYEYLAQSDEKLPDVLHGFLRNSVVLPEAQPTAVDLMPQTGKTKAKVRGR